MARIIDIEGIGETYAQKLMGVGITTTETLLDKGASAAGRNAIAKQTEISKKLILEWVNHADLFRIRGIGEEYADVLEAAGVDTVKELAQRNPDNLYEKIIKVNEEKTLVRKPPAKSEVASWIQQAMELPRMITY